MPAPRLRLFQPLVFVFMLLLAGAVLPAHAQAAGAVKPYTLKLSPPSVPAGGQSTFTATFSNPVGAQQQLGSAKLTAPAGLRLVAGSAALSGAGTVTVSGEGVLLRDLSLQPGNSVSLTIAADVACSPGLLTWSVAAKQANAFNGPPGNDLTLVAPSSLTTTITGQCAAGLRFATQPANARTGEAITGTSYRAGLPVSVEVIDSTGAVVTSSTAEVTIAPGPIFGPGTLGGDPMVNAVHGVAAFSDLTISAPGQYTLRASSPGLAPATSAVFKIDTIAAFCAEDVSCTSETTSTAKTTVGVTALAAPGEVDSGFLTMSFNTGPALDCAGYHEVSPDTALVDFTSANRAKTATLTIDKKQMATVPNNGASFLEFCFGSPAEFTTKAGTRSATHGSYDWDADGVVEVGEAVYVGLLPDCGAEARPCVATRKKVGAGDGLIQARIPAGLGDPAMRG
jgi:hypothetical protein